MKKLPPIFSIPSLPVGVGVAAFVVVAVLTFAYVVVPPQYQGAVIFFGAGAASAAAIATAFYTAKTLQIAHIRYEREPEEVAARFAERWNDASMFHARNACQALMAMRNQNREVIDRAVEGDEGLKNNMMHILNFLEELATAVRTKRADSAYSKRMFAGIVINVYNVLQHWIADERTRRQRTQLWVELRWLHEQWAEDGR